MSRLNTRPSNKDKHPGLPDLSPQRRSPAQKRADDERAAEEKQAKEDARKQGIHRLAEAEEHAMQKTKMRPGPRPRTGTSSAAMPSGPKKRGPPAKGKAPHPEVKSKKSRAERSVYRMEVDEEKTKGLQVAASKGEGKSVPNPNPNLPTPLDARKPSFSYNAKTDFSGTNAMKKVHMWMSKVKSPLPSQHATASSASTKSFVSSIANTNLTTSSLATEPLASPMGPSGEGLRYRGPDEVSDDTYCAALENLPKAAQQLPLLDIVEVNSSCPNSPASNMPTENLALSPSHSEGHIADADLDMQPPHDHDNNDTDDDDDRRGQLKSIKTTATNSISMDLAVVHEACISAKTEGCASTLPTKGESSKKATNKDLPDSAHPMYCCNVVPSVWHWAGNVADPFNIHEPTLVTVLKTIWEHVYDNVPFNIPPTLSLTNQRLSEWRNGFTSAATSAIMSLFASDDEFLQHTNRVSFASCMIQHYRFLFLDSSDGDHMQWTGMWRGPLFVQVLASHFNATTSHVLIQELNSESQRCDGAMVLAAAALECMLTLIANGEIDIRLVVENKETTGTKRKRKPTKTMMWKVKQPNGPPQPFSVTFWGAAMREYATSLRKVPSDAMASIISEARTIALAHKARTSRGQVPSDEPCSERASLAFR